MPIEYRIVHQHRVVVARAHGELTEHDVFNYQRDVWSRPDVAGYDELMDMSEGGRIVLPSVDSLKELVTVSADMDTPSIGAKFAIVAPQDVAFGLGRMFQTYRELDSRSTKEVKVFRSLIEAVAFLGLSTLP